MTTYYHVTYSAWDGEDLRSYQRMIEDGEEPPRHWEDWTDEQYDKYEERDMVCMHRTLADAIEFRDACCPDGEILAIAVPDDEYERDCVLALQMTQSVEEMYGGERYPAIYGSVPANIISRVQEARAPGNANG